MYHLWSEKACTEFLRELLEALYDELPAPKKKKVHI